MANILWEIAGRFTRKGRMRVSGASSGGDPIFDEPLELPEMIASLSESHELSEEGELSAEGRDQLDAVADTLDTASEQVQDRLIQDDQLHSQVSSLKCKTKAPGNTVSFTGKLIIESDQKNLPK